MRAKKSYGQHFLVNEGIARKIASSFNPDIENVLEVGPGKAALTRYLIQEDNINFKAVEADRDMQDFLEQNYPKLKGNIIHADFLKLDLTKLFDGKQFQIIGNFPYNISSQIIFKAIENRNLVSELVGMFQKELAERIVSDCGSKIYGVISVLTQAYFETELLFHVQPGSFSPPPKVISSVIRLTRKNQDSLGCDERLFRTIVKQSFNQRRKMLRNTLKSLIKDELILNDEVFTKRPEALSLESFIQLTRTIQNQ